ncbi:MAG: DUF6385 domain-containing protein [Firmicutes bacterium]|nr:DUF6385 domain-containing protein [Bacillota bacterium]
MNKLIKNPQAESLKIIGCGLTNDDLKPFSVDEQGRMILSPQIFINAQAANLAVRPLQSSQDSLTIAPTTLDIRKLNGSRDGLKIFNNASATATESATISLLSTVNLLVTNVSNYRDNCFVVYNTSGLTIAADISLQLAPANISNLYRDDGSTFSLLGGNRLILVPSYASKFARIRVSSLLSLVNITVHYFGRT